MSERLVRCQYNPAPHPLDEECVNVADVIDDLDEATLAGLRRVLAAIDGLLPEVEARPNPEQRQTGAADA